MRILFIGDSILKGTTGVNWIKHLAKKHPEWTIENDGVNGDTLVKIRKRLKKKLKLTRSWDVIVIEGGANDLLIPSFKDRGFFFRKAYDRLTSKCYDPLEDPADIETLLYDMVSLVRKRTKAALYLSTIGCMSEDPGFHLNEKLVVFNDIVRRVSRETRSGLIDAGRIFEQYLYKRKTSRYFLEKFINTAWFDSFQCCVLNRADALSRARRLHLTIDGLHLNSRGGVIWMHETEKQLLRGLDPKWMQALRR